MQSIPLGNDNDFILISLIFLLFVKVKDITNKAVDSFSSNNAVTGSTGVIGHYTQVVWADTTDVGCGYMTAKNNGRFETVRNFLLLYFHDC